MYEKHNIEKKILNNYFLCYFLTGGIAQMVERSLSMREASGSIPDTSRPW